MFRGYLENRTNFGPCAPLLGLTFMFLLSCTYHMLQCFANKNQAQSIELLELVLFQKPSSSVSELCCADGPMGLCAWLVFVGLDCLFSIDGKFMFSKKNYNKINQAQVFFLNRTKLKLSLHNPIKKG